MSRNRSAKKLALSCVLAVAAILLASALPARAQDAGTLRIPSDQWQYHIGDDPRCADISNAGCPTQPKPANFEGDKFYWKRIEVTLPDELRKTPQLGILEADPQFAFEIYANGKRIGGTDRPGWFHTGASARGFLTFPSSLAPDGHLLLAVRIFPVWRARSLALSVPYVLAPADRIQTAVDAESLRYLRINATHYLCFAVVGFAGFVFLLLYSVNHRLWENFWLGASFATVAGLRVVEIAPVVHLWMPPGLNVVIYETCNCTMPLLIIEFVFSFLKRPVPKVLRLLQILGFTDLLFALAPNLPPALSWLAVHTSPWAILLATLTQLWMLPACFRSTLPEMRWIGASVLFFILENAERMARQVGIPAPAQDVMWRGFDIDLRAVSYLLFALVMLIAMTFRLRRIQDRNREIEQEIAAARSVQQILIPDQLPHIPGLIIESAYLPAQEVGGDFFQILPIPNPADPERPAAFIVLGDVSGKGLKAAMTVSLIVGTLRAFAETYRSPGELLTGLNRRLHGRIDGFATCLALMIQPDGKLTIANAAHPNPYLNGAELHTEANLPLGLAPDITYTEIALQLDPDELCTLVTDGVVEATSTTRELFGFDRTQSISNQSANAIAQAAQSFGQGAPQADDITVLTIARIAVAQPALV